MKKPTKKPSKKRKKKLRKIGYARVSSKKQTLEPQRIELFHAGCEIIFEDCVSGVRASRPGLDDCLDYLANDDVLVVVALDRLGRSLAHLTTLVLELRGSGVGIMSLREPFIDTTTPQGELVFNLFSCLAQFERERLRERTRRGLDAARARGNFGGRRHIAEDDPRVVSARKLRADGMSVARIQIALGVSQSTVYRWLKVAQPDPSHT